MDNKPTGDNMSQEYGRYCREPLADMVEIEILQDYIDEMVKIKLNKIEMIQELDFQVNELDLAISNAVQQIRELDDR